MTSQQLTIRDQVAKMQPEFAKALPGHITAERFVRTAQTAIALTRNIEKVTNHRSLLAECTKAASDGLILDGREAALIIDYNGNAQYRPMMRGLLKLAYNSGEIKSLVVEAVCQGDVFDYSPTRADQPIIHKIDFQGERGEVFAVYAQATLKDGGIIFDVMTTKQINAIRDRSDAWKAFAAKKIKSTPWSTDWSEMARKTVFRRLSKYLPSSTDRDRFAEAVERIDDDYTYDTTASEQAPTQPAQQQKKRGGAAAALKDVTPKQRQDDPPPVDNLDDYDRVTGEIIDHDADIPAAGDDF